MTSQARRATTLVAILLVAVAGMLAYRLRSTAAETPEAEPTGAKSAPVVETPAERAEDRVAVEIDPPSPVAPEASAATSCALVVAAAWEDDRAPARRVPLAFYEHDGDDPFAIQASCATGDDGIARIVLPRPGRWTVSCDLGGEVVAVIERGRETQASLWIPRGGGLQGIVVDWESRPVPGASVWLSRFAGAYSGVARTQTANDGTFTIDDVGSARYVGACAPGFAPALVLDVSTTDLDDVELVLPGPGGAVRGVVLTPSEEPVPNARVWVDAARSQSSQSTFRGLARPSPPVPLETNEHGAFEWPAIAPSTFDVVVRAPAWAPWFGSFDVEPGNERSVRIVLDAGIAVHGTARRADGAPWPDVEVAAYLQGSAPLRTTRTDVSGAYQLDRLPSGALRLVAREAGGFESRARFDVDVGQVLAWDPVLEAPRALVGRVIDDAGWALSGWWVYATAFVDDERWSSSAETDSFGMFEIACQGEGPFAIEICSAEQPGIPLFTRTDVLPSSEVQTFQLEPNALFRGHLAGRLTDTAGAPLAARVVAVKIGEHGIDGPTLSPHGEARADADGRFRIGPLLPGLYSVWALPDGLPPTGLGRFDVSPPESEVAIGEHRVRPGGRVEILLASELPRDERVTLWFHDSADALIASATHGLAESELYLSPSFVEGSYTLYLGIETPHGPEVLDASFSFEIVEAQTASLVVPLD